MTLFSHARRNRGAAMISVLWMVAILSLSLFATSQLLFFDLERQADDGDTFRAELLAERGLALALHPATEKGSPLLRKEIDEYRSYAATLSSEGARLPLNAILANPDHHPVLRNLLMLWGLRREDADETVARMGDWVDPDSLAGINGAERPFYRGLGRPHHPLDRPFRSLDEVTWVAGFSLVEFANPDWRESFTLTSGGKLDLNEAPADLIEATCGCDGELARQFIVTRNGADLEAGTLDDLRFESVGSPLSLLGVPANQIETVTSRVSVNDPIARISSIGRFDRVTVEKSLTVQYGNGRWRVLQSSSRRIE